MKLIDATYFWGEINIPNTSAPGDLGNGKLLSAMIKLYGKEYLMKVLGSNVYEKFIAEIEPEDPLQIKQEWYDLYKLFINDTNKTSPIAKYVYYWFMRNNFTQTVGIGEVRGITDNAIVASPALKMVTAWNKMTNETNRIVDFLSENKGKYGYIYSGDSRFSYINLFNI